MLLLGTLFAYIVSNDAQAEEFNHFVSVDAVSVINDPFLKRRGIQVEYGYAISDRLYLGGEFAKYPDLGETDLTTLTKQIKNSNNVAPDISRMLTDVSLHAWYNFRDLEGVFGNSNNKIHMNLLFGPNIGLVATKDDATVSGVLDGADNVCPDLEALNSNSEEALFCQTQIEWHVVSGYELKMLFSKNATFVSTGIARKIYIETVNSTMLEMKDNTIFEVGFGWKM